MLKFPIIPGAVFIFLGFLVLLNDAESKQEKMVCLVPVGFSWEKFRNNIDGSFQSATTISSLQMKKFDEIMGEMAADMQNSFPIQGVSYHREFAVFQLGLNCAAAQHFVDEFVEKHGGIFNKDANLPDLHKLKRGSTKYLEICNLYSDRMRCD